MAIIVPLRLIIILTEPPCAGSTLPESARFCPRFNVVVDVLKLTCTLTLTRRALLTEGSSPSPELPLNRAR